MNEPMFMTQKRDEQGRPSRRFALPHRETGSAAARASQAPATGSALLRGRPLAQR
ncbi:MAG TPA: hypothetical protein VF704_14010 [Allosphingosinicella sp.]|jgi:hypothetical protein